MFSRFEANRRRLGRGLCIFSYTPLISPVCVNSLVLFLGHHLRVFRGGFTPLRNRFHMMQLFSGRQFAARIALLLYDSGYFASGPFSFDLRCCRLAHVCAHLVAGWRGMLAIHYKGGDWKFNPSCSARHQFFDALVGTSAWLCCCELARFSLSRSTKNFS